MKITIRFNRNTHTIELSDDATLAQLKDEITKLLNIPPENQKILKKGQQINELDKKLSESGVKNGTKLFLMASEPEKTETPQPTVGQQLGITHPPQPDNSIIDLGPPPGAIRNFQGSVSVMPKDPFIVRTKQGIAKLHIETDGLFVQYQDAKEDGSIPESERIFANDIVSYSTPQASRNEYFHLCLRTRNGEPIFYFLPNQYNNVISRVISSFINKQMM